MIRETRERHREEYDARYGQIAELKRQAETEAHDIATSRDPLNAYGAAFPKWICKLPDDSRASWYLWHCFNEALVAEGFTLAASNLANTYYSGDEITPVDYEKAAYYFEVRGFICQSGQIEAREVCVVLWRHDARVGFRGRSFGG